METWFGRKVCADHIDVADAMIFGQIHLKPGVGVSSIPADVKTDPARDLAYGAQFISTSVGRIAPATQKIEYEKAIAAAEHGTTPDFSNLDDFDRDRMQRFWDSAKKPPGTTTYERLYQSTGQSVLGSPFTSEAKQRASANYFIRAKDKRMLVVYFPSSATPCVAELWKI